DQRKNRVAIGLNQVGQNNFRNPASRVLRENHANRFITPPITARGLQGGGNVLDDRWHAQLIRQLLPQPKAVRGGLRLRKQERDYVVCAERVYTQSGNNGAVDASGNRDDCSLALELQKDGFANHGRDTFALRGSIDFQVILSTTTESLHVDTSASKKSFANSSNSARVEAAEKSPHARRD